MTDDGEVGKNIKCGTCEEILQKNVYAVTYVIN